MPQNITTTTTNQPQKPADPAPAPAPAASTPHGAINRAWLAEIANDEALLLVCAKPAYTAILITDTGVDGEITPALITQFTTDVAQARTLANTITVKTDSKEIATGGNTAAKAALLTSIRDIQKRAKQKYADTSPLTQKDYFIGQHIEKNRPGLIAAADSIAKKLLTDTLPKIDAAKVAALNQNLAGYKQSKTDQGGEQSAETGAHAGLGQMVASLALRRRKIQHAADAEWPHDDPANAGIRREFQLPPDAEFNG